MEVVKLSEVEKAIEDLSSIELKNMLPKRLLVAIHKNIDDVKWATLALTFLKCTHDEFKENNKSLNEANFEELWTKWSGKSYEKIS